jgi:starch phosphorylase
VLADDTLRSAADLGIATAGISLVHRKGYFRPEMDLGGNQTEQRDT